MKSIQNLGLKAILLALDKIAGLSSLHQSVHPKKFSEGDLVLLYDQASETLGERKFKFMWHGPYIVKRLLEKGAYELVYHKGIALAKPRNGLYIKKYYV